jgi:hypothetical protein
MLLMVVIFTSADPAAEPAPKQHREMIEVRVAYGGNAGGFMARFRVPDNSDEIGRSVGHVQGSRSEKHLMMSAQGRASEARRSPVGRPGGLGQYVPGGNRANMKAAAKPGPI